MVVLENKLALLQGIADGLRREEKHKLASLEVVFFVGRDEYAFSVAQALDVLANDTYWDERGNWTKATRAEVRVM